ncbi:MAG: exodeoxyribonuclease VII small subunit [Geminicoccaceae bacterium]
MRPTPLTVDQQALDDMGAMSFEQALGELERIVQDLERGQLELEAAIKAYERGTRLKEHCQRKLQEAHLRVEKITLRDDGTVRAEPATLD